MTRPAIEVRLHSPAEPIAQGSCPNCRARFAMEVAAPDGRTVDEVPFPFEVDPFPCPACGTVYRLVILGFALNPTGERPHPSPDDLARLERCLP